MTPDEALRQARGYKFFLTSNHAEERMEERDVDRGDIKRAIETATKCILQVDKDKKWDPGPLEAWRLEGGTDRAGVELVVVVAFRNGMLIVTVIRRDP